ncbi:MAG: Gfo/Idh/MocA family oxidoreductase [Propionicimonas sp.]|uniref:Gfo/Idh/MocA family protein n=1 Tax=Propionicimonas sp. TaxID=1955623 RepID=UPI002B201AEA|nr:Gfo/Idh/MocA family oxidoreductase [Propionicimonas sp.]MEA4943334.1 Gfo/Idh/MocA family oxidoreductase [Propionicimonas sp.]
MRFGIIGTGFISDWFVDACRVAGGTPVAICSRDADRGREFATRHGLGQVVTTPEALAGLDEVEAIYLASPIASHHDQAVIALSAGKHVLGEKTLTTSPDRARALFDLAARQQRVLLEAIRPTHDPAYRPIREAVGRLGTLRHAHFEKCQYSSRYPGFLRGERPNALDPASGNSALRDLGVYCLHPALELFGSPSRFTGTTYRLENGFEAGGTTVLDYGTFSVTCAYSKVARSVAPSVIEGEAGSLTIDSLAEPADVRLIGLDGSVEPVLSGPPRQPAESLRYEIEEFLRLCAAGEVDHPYRTNSLIAEQIITGVSLSATPTWQALR